jgi:hypothetical protein
MTSMVTAVSSRVVASSSSATGASFTGSTVMLTAAVVGCDVESATA